LKAGFFFFFGGGILAPCRRPRDRGLRSAG
jgi:hypothetical protein